MKKGERKRSPCKDKFMNKLIIFIGLIVIGAGIALGPMAYKALFPAPKRVTAVQMKLPNAIPFISQRNLLKFPEPPVEKIKDGLNDLLDIGSKISGLIIGIAGLASTAKHTHTKRKAKPRAKTIDKKAQSV